MQAAALRLTGAESNNLGYFYRRREDAESEIFLFDADEQGNGTSDLVRDTFYVPRSSESLLRENVRSVALRIRCQRPTS